MPEIDELIPDASLQLESRLLEHALHSIGHRLLPKFLPIDPTHIRCGMHCDNPIEYVLEVDRHQLLPVNRINVFILGHIRVAISR